MICEHFPVKILQLSKNQKLLQQHSSSGGDCCAPQRVLHLHQQRTEVRPSKIIVFMFPSVMTTYPFIFLMRYFPHDTHTYHLSLILVYLI
jgi:hypothetical protein